MTKFLPDGCGAELESNQRGAANISQKIYGLIRVRSSDRALQRGSGEDWVQEQLAEFRS
jgi:hypothetical protein